MDIKPIQTSYRGFRFRSRLEARWAVFFDVLGICWEYEREGYELDGIGRYLPDFWLPTEKMHVEIKGESPSQSELTKAHLLAVCTKFPVVIASGSIGYTEDEFGLCSDFSCAAFCDFDPASWGSMSAEFGCWAVMLTRFMQDKFPFRHFSETPSTADDIRHLIKNDEEYFRGVHGKTHWKYEYGLSECNGTFFYRKGILLFSGGKYIDEPVAVAINSARGARFEFGESGAAQ